MVISGRLTQHLNTRCSSASREGMRETHTAFSCISGSQLAFPSGNGRYRSSQLSSIGNIHKFACGKLRHLYF